MKLTLNILALSLVASTTSAFTTPVRSVSFTRNLSVNLLGDDSDIEASLNRAVSFYLFRGDGDDFDLMIQILLRRSTYRMYNLFQQTTKIECNRLYSPFFHIIPPT